MHNRRDKDSMQDQQSHTPAKTESNVTSPDASMFINKKNWKA